MSELGEDKNICHCWGRKRRCFTVVGGKEYLLL